MNHHLSCDACVVRFPNKRIHCARQSRAILRFLHYFTPSMDSTQRSATDAT